MSTISLVQNEIIARSTDIKNIMQPVLQKHGITYFNYFKHFHDGRVLLLTSNHLVSNHIFSNKYLHTTLNVPKNYLQNEINYYIQLPQDFPGIITDCAVHFDIANGISIAKKQSDAIEYWGYATNLNNSSIINSFYLNNLDKLEGFGSYFNNQAADILRYFEDNNLFLECHIDEYDHYGESTKLSKKQMECASLILKGLSVKAIGKEMNISARTVESHIINIKTKLSCNNRSELITRLLAMTKSSSLLPILV